MEFFNSDLPNEMPLVGVFMCRLIRNTADQPIDLLIYRQNPAFTETDGLPGLTQGSRISSLENAGVFLPAAFWKNIEHPGVATYAFSAHGSLFQLHVFATDDNYLLNVYRKAVEPLATQSQRADLQTEAIELKAVQRQLFLANERLKLASRAGNIGILDFNVQNNRFTWDEETCKIHGVPAGFKPTLQEFLQLIHPDDRAYLLSKITALDTDIDTIRIVRPDGTVRFVKCQSMQLPAGDGHPFNMIGVLRDVTEESVAQIALTDSEKRYRFLVNNLKEVIFQTDLQLNLLFLSPAWIELTGFDLEGTLADDPFAYIHPEDHEICRRAFGELVQQTIEHSLLEIRYLNREGGYRWIEVFTKLTYDEYKRPSGTIGTIYDISERKRMEMELQEREKRFKAIFNSTFQFIALTDVEGNLLEINKTALAARGVTREEIIGKPFWKPTLGRVYKDVQRIQEGFRLAAQGRAVQFEIEVLDSNQEVTTIDFSISPIRDDDGRVIFLLPEGRDISEMKKARGPLLKVNNASGTLPKMWMRFFGSVPSTVPGLFTLIQPMSALREKHLRACTKIRCHFWSLFWRRIDNISPGYYSQR